jgi:hypothetical protein
MGQLIRCHMRDIYVVYAFTVVMTLQDMTKATGFNILAEWLDGERHASRIERHKHIPKKSKRRFGISNEEDGILPGTQLISFKETPSNESIFGKHAL